MKYGEVIPLDLLKKIFNMFIVRLWGGVGNQLFQYAFGEFLRTNYKLDVCYDIGSFGTTDKLREFELQLIAPDLLICDNIYFSKFRGFINRVLRSLYSIRNKFITEKDFSLEKISLINPQKKVYLQGYWQKEIYAKSLIDNGLYFPKKEIPKELEEVELRIKSSENSVALHVRRGDYFHPKNIDTWGVCDVCYYERALSYLQSVKGNCKIFVFSDDLEWVRNNIQITNDAFFVPNYNVSQYWYIYLMSLCGNNIISNSSFSWWGAYLNNKNDKIVISPSKWNLKTNKTLALDNWVKV